jgi:fructokinase
LELGPEIVVLTLGEKGAILGDSQGNRSRIHANHVPVVDVTGAGDAFWSGMIAGLLQQRSNLDSAKLGLILAESKISQIGPDIKDKSLTDYEKLIIDIVSS